MPSMLPEQKLSRHLSDNCADSRLNEVAVANHMIRQHSDVQARFFNILLAYVYAMAGRYEMGTWPTNTYEVARLSKKMKDLALDDEMQKPYAYYGDYEMENGLI